MRTRTEEIARLLAARRMKLTKDPTGATLLDDIWKQCESQAEVINSLEAVYDLCTVHAAPNAFHNGVTDATGTIDEGDYHASRILDDLKGVIARMLEGDLLRTAETAAG